jgi:hypothetical protein
MGALFVLAMTLILLYPFMLSRNQQSMREGDIAVEDIRSPRDITYVSAIQTGEARDLAAAAVEDVYSDPDPRIGRQQVRRAQQIVDFIRDVRADSYADNEVKVRYLRAISGLELGEENAGQIVRLTDVQFEQVSREMLSLIEESMSGTVEEGHEEEVIGQLELKVSTAVPEDLVPLTVELASRLIVPNSILKIAETEAAREAVRAQVPEIEHSFQRGEIVVRAAERIDVLDYEALVVLGITESRLSWKDAASAFLVSLLSGTLLIIYLLGFARDWLDEPGRLALLLGTVLLFVVGAQLLIPKQTQIAYLYPAAALSLILTGLVGVEYAVLATLILSVVVGTMAESPFDLSTFVLVSGLFAAGSLRRTTRINAYFLSGLAAAIGGAAVLLIFLLPADVDPAQLATLILISVLNGLLSTGVALVMLFIIGSLTGLTTSLRLIDLARADHPLQKRLQQEALGTYQHSLAVANIAEAAADVVGADSLLVRVGALYHDIGKMNNPGFFVENYTEGGRNPHDDIGPLASARIIRAHVTEGVEMAHRYRLPPRVIDFIAEHHGTMPVGFFLHKAREEARIAKTAVDESQFYYDGPAPQSRETAILMMADCCESAARANRPSNGNEIEELVTRLIQQRLDTNQFDDAGLTLTDIKRARESIVRTLKGMYHPRIRYPEDRRRSPARLKAGQGGALPAGTEAAGETPLVIGAPARRISQPAPASDETQEAATHE